MEAAARTMSRTGKLASTLHTVWFRASPAQTTYLTLHNRPPLTGSPSLCTLDSALVPLPSFLLVAALIVLVVTHFAYPKKRQECQAPRILRLVYLALVLAAFCMNLVEIIRLSLQREGVGLIPMNLVGLAIILGKLYHEKHGRTRPLIMLFAAYFGLLIIFQAIKVKRLHELVIVGFTYLSRQRATYYDTAQLTDNAITLGFYCVCFIIEEDSRGIPGG
ncbi:hypothetical protein PLICRDRAFT_644084 [Plicaturopsis crispa FD-325 SS-3]|nr:hypothetical protein PLICRDRAFT_644084 [Plicaturopsis crispa FD-325 SS-3]